MREGQFLEDTHVSLLSGALGFNLLVVREYDNQIIFAYYDFGCDLDLAVFNFYPHHYVLINKFTISGKVCYDNQLFSPEPGCFCNQWMPISFDTHLKAVPFSEIVDLSFFSRTEHLLLTYPGFGDEEEVLSVSSGEVSEISDLFDDQEDQSFSLDLPVLPPNPAISLIFSYMQSFGRFKYDHPAQVLEAFKILHYTVLDTIQYTDQRSLHMPQYFSKLYYKCRHDTFVAICLDRKNSIIETDVSLDKYINSQRTPDFISETDNSITLYEFTVSNLYETADFNKGGGISSKIPHGIRADYKEIEQIV